MKTHKEIATDFEHLIVAGKVRVAYDLYVSPDFLHHNPYFDSGRESLLKGMEENAGHFPNKIYEIKRVIEDGDLVVTHSRLQLTPDMPEYAVIHIYSFKDNMIVEEWDLSQAAPEDSPNQSGLF